MKTPYDIRNLDYDKELKVFISKTPPNCISTLDPNRLIIKNFSTGNQKVFLLSDTNHKDFKNGIQYRSVDGFWFIWPTFSNGYSSYNKNKK